MSSSPISSSSSEIVEADEAVAGPLVPLFDVTCTVDFILGTGTVKVRDCVGMSAETIVRLDQPASPVEYAIVAAHQAHQLLAPGREEPGLDRPGGPRRRTVFVELIVRRDRRAHARQLRGRAP